METKKSINLLSPELISETREIVQLNSIYKRDGVNIAEGTKISLNVYGKKTVQNQIHLNMTPFRIKIPELQDGQNKQEILRATYLAYINELDVQKEIIRSLNHSINDFLKILVDKCTEFDKTANDDIDEFNKIIINDINSYKNKIIEIDKKNTAMNQQLENFINQKYCYWEEKYGTFKTSFKEFDETMINYFKNLGFETNIETLSLIQRLC